jgi:hypothetical protein
MQACGASRGRRAEGDVLGQEAGEKGEEEGLGREGVAGAALEAQGGGVEVGHLAGVAGEDRGRGAPEEAAPEGGVAGGEGLDRLGVEGDGDDEAVLAPALEGVGVRGCQKEEGALGEVAPALGHVVAQRAVLDPEELEEVVIVEALRARGGQRGAGQGDGVASQDLGVAEGADGVQPAPSFGFKYPGG